MNDRSYRGHMTKIKKYFREIVMKYIHDWIIYFLENGESIDKVTAVDKDTGNVQNYTIIIFHVVLYTLPERTHIFKLTCFLKPVVQF